MPESKSGALPLGDIPISDDTLFALWQELPGIKKKNGVGEGIRTLGLQSHNLTR